MVGVLLDAFVVLGEVALVDVGLLLELGDALLH